MDFRKNTFRRFLHWEHCLAIMAPSHDYKFSRQPQYQFLSWSIIARNAHRISWIVIFHPIKNISMFALVKNRHTEGDFCEFLAVDAIFLLTNPEKSVYYWFQQEKDCIFQGWSEQD